MEREINDRLLTESGEGPARLYTTRSFFKKDGFDM